jgi:hypothetical protein
LIVVSLSRSYPLLERTRSSRVPSLPAAPRRLDRPLRGRDRLVFVMHSVLEGEPLPFAQISIQLIDAYHLPFPRTTTLCPPLADLSSPLPGLASQSSSVPSPNSFAPSPDRPSPTHPPQPFPLPKTSPKPTSTNPPPAPTSFSPSSAPCPHSLTSFHPTREGCSLPSKAWRKARCSSEA